MQLLVTGGHRKGRRQSRRAAALGSPVARRTCQGAVSQPLDRGDRSHRGRQRKHRRPRSRRSRNADVTRVVHLATYEEIPEIVMDVTVKGLFWLLEAFRQSTTAKQFMLIGGDAAVGHFFYDHQEPITEHTPHRAYPGCYALSKVLEEVMLSQFAIQYGINTCCLRAPWIMEKDDFRYSLSFGDDVFGGPV